MPSFSIFIRIASNQLEQQKSDGEVDKQEKKLLNAIINCHTTTPNSKIRTINSFFF